MKEQSSIYRQPLKAPRLISPPWCGLTVKGTRKHFRLRPRITVTPESPRMEIVLHFLSAPEGIVVLNSTLKSDSISLESRKASMMPWTKYLCTRQSNALYTSCNGHQIMSNEHLSSLSTLGSSMDVQDSVFIIVAR